MRQLSARRCLEDLVVLGGLVLQLRVEYHPAETVAVADQSISFRSFNEQIVPRCAYTL